MNINIPLIAPHCFPTPHSLFNISSPYTFILSRWAFFFTLKIIMYLVLCPQIISEGWKQAFTSVWLYKHLSWQKYTAEVKSFQSLIASVKPNIRVRVIFKGMFLTSRTDSISYTLLVVSHNETFYFVSYVDLDYYLCSVCGFFLNFLMFSSMAREWRGNSLNISFSLSSSKLFTFCYLTIA